MGRKAPKREPCFLTKIWTSGRWTTIIIYNQHPLQSKGCAWFQLEAEGLVLQHKESSWIIFLWVPKTWSIYYDFILFLLCIIHLWAFQEFSKPISQSSFHSSLVLNWAAKSEFIISEVSSWHPCFSRRYPCWQPGLYVLWLDCLVGKDVHPEG